MCPARGMGHYPRVSPASVSSERRWVMKHQCCPFYFQSFLFHSTEKQTNRGTAQGEKRYREPDRTVVLVFRDQRRQEVGVEGCRGTPICQAE